MSLATGHENPNSGPGKPPKSGSTRRKISLPWFRQASIGEKLTRLRLPRQNTVDCPSRSCSSNEHINSVRRKVMSNSSSIEVDMSCMYNQCIRYLIRMCVYLVLQNSDCLKAKYLTV